MNYTNKAKSSDSFQMDFGWVQKFSKYTWKFIDKQKNSGKMKA